MNTHPDTLNGLTYAELKPIISTIVKIYPMNKLCGETAEKICDKLRLPDSYNDDTLRSNLSKFLRTVSKQGLDGRHDIQQEHTGKDKPQWVFRFCDEWRGAYATKTEAIHAAQFFEVQRKRGFIVNDKQDKQDKPEPEPKPRIKFNKWGQVTEHFLEINTEGRVIVKDGRTLEEYLNDPHIVAKRKNDPKYKGGPLIMLAVATYEKLNVSRGA